MISTQMLSMSALNYSSVIIDSGIVSTLVAMLVWLRINMLAIWGGSMTVNLHNLVQLFEIV